jgi:predicted nucleic acid-binding protein
MKPLFLDTSFVVALHASDDQSHRHAVDGWLSVLSQRRRLITTTFILDETATLLNARGLHELAVTAGTQIIKSPAVTLLHVDVGLLERGWAYFCRHADKRYSLTDCISFVVMQERGLREALTFDQHFTQAGFEVAQLFRSE